MMNNDSQSNRFTNVGEYHSVDCSSIPTFHGPYCSPCLDGQKRSLPWIDRAKLNPPQAATGAGDARERTDLLPLLVVELAKRPWNEDYPARRVRMVPPDAARLAMMK